MEHTTSRYDLRVARVLVLSSFYPPHHFGGYELACYDVVQRWRARGHDVHILTSTKRWPEVPTPEDEPVDRTLELYWRDFEHLSPHPLLRLRTEMHNQRALKDVLRRHRPDVVSVWMMGWMSFGLLTTVAERNLPMVCVLQDDWLDFGPSYDAWARLFLDRPRAARVVRAVTGVPTTIVDLGRAASFCFISEHTRRHAEERSRWQFPIASTVWSGVDRSIFNPMPRPSDWQWRLLFVGRIRDTKGVDTAIKALAQLPPAAHLTIIGKGDPDYEVEMRTLADELGVTDRIAWETATRDELPKRYADADALIFPSRWREPFGLVPLEAMACGTPVVATGRGGSGEFCIDEVTCLRFEVNDADGLAACIRRLADDPDLRARIVQGGFAAAGDLTVDRLADVLEEWHLAAIDRFAHGTPGDRQLALSPS
jgi:glycosyltransferase involved in cell wall biosynthesis